MDAHKRRTQGINEGAGFEGVQIPPPKTTTGYQPLRSSADVPNPIGQPYTRLDNEGRSWYTGRCYVITIVVFIALIGVGCVVTGVIVHHHARTDIETKRCGTIEVPVNAECVDIIIGGCGTAGSAAAREITNDPTLSVMCIEEGPDWYNKPEVLDGSNFFAYVNTLDGPVSEKFMYDYHTPFEAGALGVGLFGPQPGRLHIRGGRVLGGSAVINYQLAFKNTESTWDEWDAMVGSPGTLTGAAMYALYKDIEHLNAHGHYAFDATRGDGTLPSQTVKIDVHPHGSYIGLDYEAFVNLIEGALGLTKYTDISYNSLGNRLGTYAHSEFLKDFDTTTPELRWSSRQAFLGSSVMDQQMYVGVAPRQLIVKVNSSVFELLSVPTPEGPRFVGVSYKGSDGKTHNAYARHAVVATFGVNSAAVLQRSGVGPATILEEANVAPVIINEHVGQHLQTSAGWTALFFWPNVTGADPDPDFIQATQVFMIQEDKTIVGTPGREAFLMVNLGLAPTIFAMGGLFARAKSEGSIRVHTRDPLQPPEVRTNALTNPDDLTSIRGVLRDTINSITAYDPTVISLSIDPMTLANDALLDQFIRLSLVIDDDYHGTCRMSTSAGTGVVDTEFRVFGAASGSLRVCDLQASANHAFPNPFYTAMGIGVLCGRHVVEAYGSAAAKKSMPLHRVPRKESVRPPPPVQNKKSSRTSGIHATKIPDEEMWDIFVAAIDAVVSKMGANSDKTQKLIASIMMNPEYKRLEAIYGGTPARRRRKQNTKTA